MIELAAAILAGMTTFVLVGVVTGQFAHSYRQALARATAVASRTPVSSRTRVRVLRSDGFARSASLAAMLRRWEWAKTRAVLLDRANVPLKVSEWVLVLTATFTVLAIAGAVVSGLPLAGIAFGLGGCSRGRYGSERGRAPSSCSSNGNSRGPSMSWRRHSALGSASWRP